MLLASWSFFLVFIISTTCIPIFISLFDKVWLHYKGKYHQTWIVKAHLRAIGKGNLLNVSLLQRKELIRVSRNFDFTCALTGMMSTPETNESINPYVFCVLLQAAQNIDNDVRR